MKKTFFCFFGGRAPLRSTPASPPFRSAPPYRQKNKKNFFRTASKKSFRKLFFKNFARSLVVFFCFFFRFGKNQKTTVNPLRNNFGLFWRIFFAIGGGGGIKKNILKLQQKREPFCWSAFKVREGISEKCVSAKILWLKKKSNKAKM